MAFKEPQIGTVGELANRMRLSRAPDGLAPITFLIGAGCSVTAGIPAAKAIAQNEVQKLAIRFGNTEGLDPAAALAFIAAKGTLAGHKEIAENDPKSVDWGSVYDAIFAEVWTAPDEVSTLFKTVIKDAKPAINWAHLALGELARRDWIATTITTNFDLLALEGYARAGVIPVVSDGIESLGRIASRPDQAQLLQINGSVHAYRLRNSPADLENLKADAAAITCFNNLFQQSNVLVIVGYEGREPQIMSLLIEAAKRFPDKHIFWCLYSRNPKDLSERATEFLSHSANARLLIGQDADKFFHDLCHSLGVGAPEVFRDPIGFINGRLGTIFEANGSAHGEIRKEIDALKTLLTRLSSCEVQLPMPENRDEGDPEQPDDGDTKAVSEAIVRRIKKQHIGDADAVFDALCEEQDRWYSIGRDHGRVLDLEISILLAEACLALASTPEQRRSALNDLGISLCDLGRREGNLFRLQAGVEAIKAALLEVSRDQEPLAWASTQNNLGNALQILGKREDDPTRFAAAVTAYENALLEYTLDRVPSRWATTQNNLGTAQSELGRRENDSSRLLAALEAFVSALQEYSRERAPLDWAMAQYNLGSVLVALGREESNLSRLISASKAYEAASLEFTRERAPLNWAQTQSNLSDLDLAFHALSPDPVRLISAREKALAAREVFVSAKASAYVEGVDLTLSKIDAAQGEVNPTTP